MSTRESGRPCRATANRTGGLTGRSSGALEDRRSAHRARVPSGGDRGVGSGPGGQVTSSRRVWVSEMDLFQR